MAELELSIAGAAYDRYAVAPHIVLTVHVRSPEPVQCVMLNTQIRIEAVRRAYGAAERERLQDLFGPPEHWRRSLGSLLWANVSLTVPGFEREKRIELPVPCSTDFNVAAARYFESLQEGEVPLIALFGGTVFRDGAAGLTLQPIARSREARWRMPLSTWQEMIEHHYPGTAWLQVSRETYEALQRHRRAQGCLTLDHALARLIGS